VIWVKVVALALYYDLEPLSAVGISPDDSLQCPNAMQSLPKGPAGYLQDCTSPARGPSQNRLLTTP